MPAEKEARGPDFGETRGALPATERFPEAG